MLSIKLEKAKPMTNNLLRRATKALPNLFLDVLRYASTGVFVFASVYGTNNLLFYLGLSASAATLSASAVGAVAGYFLHARFSFRVRKHTWTMPAKFAVRQLVCIGLAQLVIYLCSDVLGIFYPIASFLASAASTVAAFLLARFWVFPKIEQPYEDSTT